MMYSIYVGNYKTPAIAKDDVAKLNHCGLRGYVFSRGDHYALKVYSSPSFDKASQVKELLEQRGFVVELETIDIKNCLHLK